MNLEFYKYQGTGNDFVMIDNRDLKVSKNNTKLIKQLCDRRFGIGGDGLILLEEPDAAEDDFKMVYFNADGNPSSMCGNGGRCLVAFANYLGIVEKTARFTAIDGPHKATISEGIVSLKMQNVTDLKLQEEYSFLDTGSPHHVVFVEDVQSEDVQQKGSEIRYSEMYKDNNGTNVNFVQQINDGVLKVRTYERGVEDETFSCGTGVTAVAIAAYQTGKIQNKEVKLETPGGSLEVKFEKTDSGFENIWLTGPAVQVFKGEIVC
ncbi:diaminopimelate epimerase [Christiangramia sp. LLG6405-1]|uniref:diaminopimelate epimerase n=1 Tax=Christiangramia sp. LLG6405-1 TaxID=3160832 RepID=UPI00386300E3